MAASSDRLAANAANAQRSTGPRSAEGKARSSRNATKHGLTSSEFVVHDGEQEEFDEFLASYSAELNPQGAIERTLFQQLAHAAWNLQRIRRMEAEIWRTAAQDGALCELTGESAGALERLARYQARTERSYYRALRELRTEQTNRAQRGALDRTESEKLPQLASVAQVTRHTEESIDTTLQLALRRIDLETEMLLASRRAGRNTTTCNEPSAELGSEDANLIEDF